MSKVSRLSVIPLRKRKDLMTLAEIAQAFNLNLGTLRVWASQRRFPLYKVGAKVMVSGDEFDAWIEKFYCKPKKRVYPSDLELGEW